MGICYPGREYLATGGAFGNTLFFFISGFTLFLGKPSSFPDYFKRRVSRIYPTVIAIALISTVFMGNKSDIVSDLFRYWFINCIMIYYAILWVCRFLKLNLVIVMAASLILTMSIFLIIYDFDQNNLIYGNDTFRYFIYFTFMAQGAYLGLHRHSLVFRYWHVLLLIISVIAWYAINFLFAKSAMQMLSVPILYAFCYSIYACVKPPIINTLITNHISRNIILFCGGLCLESYVIQFPIITDRFNSIFPLNVPLVMLSVIIGAYGLYVFSRFISQTFDSGSYNWMKIMKVW